MNFIKREQKVLFKHAEIRGTGVQSSDHAIFNICASRFRRFRIRKRELLLLYELLIMQGEIDLLRREA